MSGEGSYKCNLSEQLQEKAKTELNETHEKRTISLKRLRQMVKEFPGLNSPTDDAFLLRFLRARKFDLDRSLKLVVQYFRVRKEYPDIFENFRPSSVKEVLKDQVTTVLPERDEHGRKFILFRPGLWDVNRAEITDLFRTNLLTMEKLIEDEETQINGIKVLNDMQGFGMSHAMYMSPSQAKKFFSVIQDAFPMRLKGVHYINEPSIIGYVFPIVRQFMSEKMRNRLHFHGHSFEDLHKSLSPEMLPTAYGGNLDFKYEEWGEHLLSCENKYEEMLQYGLTEDTPGVKGNDLQEDALQGMSGTFRKLNVD